MPRQRRNHSYPIEQKGVPFAWQWLIAAVEKRALKDVGFSDGRVYASVVRIHTLHHLIKKEWNPQHKSPSLPKDDKEYVKAIGEVYYRAYKLCEKCFLGAIGYSRNYQHPSIWFGWILEELALTDTGGANFSRKYPYWGKENLTKFLQHQNSQLRDYINPFDPTHEVHTWRLIESSAGFAESNAGLVFDKEYWKIFLKAREQYVRLQRKPNVMALSQNESGEVFVTLPYTRGKSKVPLNEWRRNYKKRL